MPAINKSNFENSWLRFDGSSKALVHFQFLDLNYFLAFFVKDFMKKPPVFITDVKSAHNLIFFHNDFRSRKCRQ